MAYCSYLKQFYILLACPSRTKSELYSLCCYMSSSRIASFPCNVLTIFFKHKYYESSPVNVWFTKHLTKSVNRLSSLHNTRWLYGFVSSPGQGLLSSLSICTEPRGMHALFIHSAGSLIINIQRRKGGVRQENWFWLLLAHWHVNHSPWRLPGPI